MKYISIYELAEKLNVSPPTIYKKIKNKEIKKMLNPYIKIVNGNTKFNLDGINILQTFIKVNENENNNNGQTHSNSDLSDVNSLQSDYINLLKTQIAQKDKIINEQLRLIENSQILLKQHQEKTFLLETEKTNKPEKVNFWRKFLLN